MERQPPPPIVVLLLILFIIFTPDRTPRRRFQFDNHRIQDQRNQDFDVLANYTHGAFNGRDRWLNLSGFREDDGFQWDLLPKAQDRSLAQRRQSLHGSDAIPFYQSITGEIRGDWVRSDLSSTKYQTINLTAVDPQKEYLSSSWSRNITEDHGEITFTLHDDDDTKNRSGVRELKAEIGLYSDSSPGNGWQTILQGVHLPGGSAILTTASSKFDAHPALPLLMPDQKFFEVARTVMNKTVAKLWEKKIDQELDSFGLPYCELIVFLQPRPLVNTESAAYVELVESELNDPEGAPIGEPPPLSFSAVIYSPDCGYVLEAENVYGPKIEAYSRLAGQLLVAFISILGLQMFLLKRQMEQASTPSTRARISYQGIFMAASGDGLWMITMLALLTINEVGILVAAAVMYMVFMHVSVLEVKFIFDIWTIQVGNPMQAEQDRRRRENPPAPAPTGLPLPVTAPRFTDATAVPIIMTSDGELDGPPSARAAFATIYAQFYFVLMVLVLISLWAVAWPRSLRSAYTNLLVGCYFCLWWPQIYRNAMRNCRKALMWEYVIGSTVLRTVPVLYWYLSPRNILSINTSPTTAFIFLGWIWLQVLILISQQFLGPRLLIKDSWCPPAYEYHPVLQEDDVEAGGMSIGLLASASEAKDKDDKTRKVFDCAICMNEIDVPVLSKGEAGRGAAWLEQRRYMVTPCRHIFHAECLEGWMNLRLVCPVCRESLPPL